MDNESRYQQLDHKLFRLIHIEQEPYSNKIWLVDWEQKVQNNEH